MSPSSFVLRPSSFVLPLVLGLVSLWSAEAYAATRVDNGDGTYSYDTAFGYQGPTTITEGVLTLEYVGPARYSWVPSTLIGSTVEENGTIDLPIDPVDGLIGGTIIDDAGIEWEITAVDRIQLAVDVSAYLAQFGEVEGTSGELVSGGTYSTALCYDYAAGLEEEPGYLELEGHPNYDDYHYIDASAYTYIPGTSNVLYDVADFDTGMTSAIVRVDLPAFMELDSPHCSGTLIADDWVLTAAHCIYDENTGNTIDPEDEFGQPQVRVAQYPHTGVTNNGAVVDSIRINHKYLDWQWARYDWALLHLTSPIGADGHHMALSRASDSRIENIDSIDEYQMAGLPGITHSGGTNNSHIQWNGDGSHEKTNNKSLRIDITHGSGNSGGAHFYDGSTPGGTWYVYSVHSGHRTGVNWSAKGPKVPFHHEAIIGLAGL